MFTKLIKWIMSRQQDTLYVPGVDEPCKHFLLCSDSSINGIGIDYIPNRCLSSLYISSENASFSPVAL